VEKFLREKAVFLDTWVSKKYAALTRDGTVTVEVGHFIFTTSERKKRGEKRKRYKERKGKKRGCHACDLQGAHALTDWFQREC
jgi:DNA-binding transcriptional regulator YhcF (GntR family)